MDGRGEGSLSRGETSGKGVTKRGMCESQRSQNGPRRILVLALKPAPPAAIRSKKITTVKIAELYATGECGWSFRKGSIGATANQSGT